MTRQATTVPDGTTFARALDRAMTARNVNLKQLAARTGINVQTISNLRRGLNSPRLATAAALADALDWEPLARITEQQRRRSCGVCSRTFITDHNDTKRGRFCSRKCQQVGWNRNATKGRDRKRAKYEKKSTMLLREHQQAVEAFCRACEAVDFLCRDAGCALRGVSPLPLIKLERRVA